METDQPSVLIVQDDEGVARSWEKFFQADGWNVYVTDLGEDGVDLATHYSYDLIYVDAGLPDTSGLVAIRQMRAAGVEETIVSINSCTFPEWVIASYEAGADAVLVFMCSRQEILAQARALLRRAALPQASPAVDVAASEGGPWRPSAGLYRAWSRT